MSEGNNVNNVSFTNVKQQCNNVDNVSESKHRNVEVIADKLVDKFRSPFSRKFYIKMAYLLSEAQIWNNVELSTRKRNPAAYFNWLCRRDADGRNN